MRPWTRWAILGVTAVVLVLLFAVLRPSEGDDPSPTPTTPGTPTGSQSPGDTPSPTTSPTRSPEPEITTIEVTYRDGAVQGPTRREVTLGDRVRLLVRADVSDHVHLHGYDLMADVGPGEPARITFRADAPGVFEVELEDAGTPLIELVVAP